MSRDGGQTIAEILLREGVQQLFTLCGGHISPILVAAKERGIRVVDVRNEASAVFAADAVGRMTGIPGVAAVTAGPGVTNTVTAVKNAQLAESPVVVFGGATTTLLKGRGALQDIDQLSLMRPICKWATEVKTLAALAPAVEKAFAVAREGIPGPVFIEVPVDLLYPEAIVREWYFKEGGGGESLAARAKHLYLRGHLYRQFHAPDLASALPRPALPSLPLGRGRELESQLQAASAALRSAERPVLVVGSQSVGGAVDTAALALSIGELGIPTYLAGMARGLLGRRSELQFRHKRSAALRDADVVVVAGFPFDFRLNYGRAISSRATVIAAHLERAELRRNRRPEIALEMHPGEFLKQLAALGRGAPATSWLEALRSREDARDAEIAAEAPDSGERVHPLAFFRRLEEKLADDSILIVDGGDFVASASYVLRPRAPLSWLDPGVFGTLGVGGGFAIGASVVRPQSQVWLLYGDGSSAYSLAEFDTFARHGLAPIAVVGNNGAWAQIAREQREILGDDVGTVLRRTPYQRVAEGYGGVGLLLDIPSAIDETLDAAIEHARAGRPVCINVHLADSDFRKGSISM